MNHQEYIELVKAQNYPNDPTVPLPHNFIDERGIIQNLLFANVGSIALITSKKGTKRSNHFHIQGSHFLYVINGSIKYFERNVYPVNNSFDNKVNIYNTNQMFFTAPMKVHLCEFLEDTTMISMNIHARETDFDLEDTIKMEF